MATRAVESVIEGTITVSNTAWNSRGEGAFGELVRLGPEWYWEVRIIDSEVLTVRESFRSPRPAAFVHWLSEALLALVVTTDTNEGEISCGTALLTLDLTSGQCREMSVPGQVLPPVRQMPDGDLWCVQTCPETGYSAVYSCVSRRVLWSPGTQKRAFTNVVDLREDGRALVLTTHKYPQAILGEALSHLSRAGGLLRALWGRAAVPTRVSVVQIPSGDVLWTSEPEVVTGAALAPDGRVCCTVPLWRGAYGVKEYEMLAGHERVLWRARSRLELVGWSECGWVVLEGNERLVLVSAGQAVTLYPVEGE